MAVVPKKDEEFMRGALFQTKNELNVFQKTTITGPTNEGTNAMTMGILSSYSSHR